MSPEALALVSVGSLYLALRLALPVLVTAAVVGVLVGFFQAGSQTSEPSVAFVAKLVAAAAVLFFAHAFMGEALIAFSAEVVQRVAQVAR